MGLNPYHSHGMNKIMETAVKDIQIFINRELDNRLSKIQPVTSLEQTHVSLA
jgi:hypothetical protein